MPRTVEVLREARSLISDPGHWTQERFARDANSTEVSPSHPNAVCWCMLGAIDKVGKPFDPSPTEKALLAALETEYDLKLTSRFHILVEFNDTHTHAEVLAAFDRAIAAEEQKGAPE